MDLQPGNGQDSQAAEECTFEFSGGRHVLPAFSLPVLQYFYLNPAHPCFLMVRYNCSRFKEVFMDELSMQAADFSAYLSDWMTRLPQTAASEIFNNPEACAIVSVDLIKGFCDFGPLSSPRVKAIVSPVAALFTAAYEHGVQALAFTQDTHEPDRQYRSQVQRHGRAGVLSHNAFRKHGQCGDPPDTGYDKPAYEEETGP